MTQPETSPWIDSLEATVAAPESHLVVFENDQVRVLEVVIPAGMREPEHTHARPSVMTVTEPARIRYFEGDKLVSESGGGLPQGPQPPRWTEPEGPHSVENIDDHTYRAYRIEHKQLSSGAAA